MLETKIDQLLELIDLAVNESGPWRDKAQYIKIRASDDQLTALYEFVTWFQEEEEAA